MERKSPNVLLAVADDASHFGCYGHRFVNTPTIDRVAEEGVLLQNAFTVNPKCAPSRACVLTGMHTWQLEEACNHFSIFPSKFAVFPDILEDHGYFVGYTGKGWAPGDYEAGGFRRNPAGHPYQRRFLAPPEDTGISKCDYAGNFADFLAARPPETPFYFWYGAFEPHRPYAPGEGMRAGKSLEDIDHVPRYWPDDGIVRGDLLDYAREIDWFDAQLGLMLDQLEAIGELDNTIVMVTSDNGCPFPRVKGQMYEQDFHLPFVVMWKDGVADGRQLPDLVSFVDIAPTILEVVGIEPHPQMAGHSFLSLLSGKGDATAEQRKYVYFGREKHDVGSEGDRSYPVRCIRNREYLYIRNFEPERWPAGDPETWYANCDGGPTKERILELHAQGENLYYQLAFGRRPMEELYHVAEDPECLNNLASDQSHDSVRTELWLALEKKLKETRDPRILGQGDIFDTYPYVGKTAHSWKAYQQGQWVKQPY